jgi:enamine deaminase RidA (YjgF/YER057c/UK114 family)
VVPKTHPGHGAEAHQEETVDIAIIRSSAPRPLAHYNECFKVGPWVFAAGQIASDYQTGVAPEARKRPGFPYYGSDIKLQTQYVLGNLTKTFEAAGSSLDQVVRAQVFLRDLNHFTAFDEVWRDYFPVPPPRTTIGTTGLLVPGTLVEIDLIGYVAGPGMQRRMVTSAAPRPLAHAPEACTIGHLIFAAGHVASDGTTGVPTAARMDPAFLADGSDIKQQTRSILEHLKATFAAAGSSLDEVLKAQVFLTDLTDFNGFDEVWHDYFPVPPARTTVGTSGLLVVGGRVAIDLIGRMPGTPSQREAITSSNPPPLAHDAEAFCAGDLIFAAGQLASDFTTGVAPEARVDPAFPYYGSPIKKQTRYILNNLKHTFTAAGSSLDHVVKAQVFLTDLNDFYAFDEVWKEFFTTPPPRTTVGISGLLVEGCRIAIDLIGVRAPKVL